MAQFIRYKFMGRDLIDWNPEEFCGYKPKTTYYSDFSIAEPFGLDSVLDTYKRAIEAWGKNIEWMTEIVMVLNWKIWEHHGSGNEGWAKFYNELWEKAVEYVHENFEGDDLDYYYRTTD